MKNLIIAVSLLLITGCASPYQEARQDINRQYSELEQIQDLGLRQQKFRELQQRENILVLEHQARQARAAAAWQGYMIYQGLTQPKNYNVRVW